MGSQMHPKYFGTGRKKEALRLSVDLNVDMNGNVIDEEFPIPDIETTFHNLLGASYFGKIDLSDAYYQIELDEDAEENCTTNISQGFLQDVQASSELENFFIHLQKLRRIKSQRNQV